MKEIQITRTVYEPGDIIKCRDGLKCVIIKARESKNGLLSYIVLLQDGQKAVKTESDMQKAEFETHSAEIEEFFHIEEETEKPKKRTRKDEYILKDSVTGEFLVKLERAEDGNDSIYTYEYGTTDPDKAKRFTREEADRAKTMLSGDPIVCLIA